MNQIKKKNGQYYLEKKTKYGFFHTYEDFNLDGYSRKIKLLLPEEYKNSKKHYPVVYMNDGNTVFDSEGLSPWSWNAHKTVRNLMKHNLIEPVIIVAVYPIDRNYEYLSVKKFHEWTGHIVHAGGGLQDYANYLAFSLKPFIDRSYRTLLSNEKTSIVGSSFGGLASLYISCVHNTQFGNAGVLSPAFFEILNQKIKIENNTFIKNITKSIKSAKTKPLLWIDWGEEEGLDEPEVSYLSKKVVNLFKNKLGFETGKNLFYFKDKFGTHDERAWEYRFKVFLKTLYKIDQPAL